REQQLRGRRRRTPRWRREGARSLVFVPEYVWGFGIVGKLQPTFTVVEIPAFLRLHRSNLDGVAGMIKDRGNISVGTPLDWFGRCGLLRGCHRMCSCF